MSYWPSKALSCLGAVVTGSTPRTSEKHFFGGNIPFVTPADLDQSSPIMETPRTLTEAGLNEIRVIPSGAVLVCCIGSLGKIGIAGRPLATNQQINSIVFDEEQILPRFGFYACRRLKSTLVTMAPATTVAIVSKSKFERLEIPVPPLGEQERIAGVLDQAEMLNNLRQRTIDRLSDLAQATFYEMFGDPATNPMKWPIGTIDDLTESTQYGTSSKAGGAGEFPILRMGNLTLSGGLDFSDLKYIDLAQREIEKYTVRDGDILFNRTNSPDLVGKTAVYRGKDRYAFAGYLIRLRTNARAEPEYLSAYLNSAFGKKVLRGMCKAIIGMANINAKELRTISIPIVPVELQKQFKSRIVEIGKVLPILEKSRASQASLYACLQNRAFSGEL